MQAIIEAVAAFIKKQFQGESSGHDWEHIHRVAKLARLLADKEGADPDVAELAALVHDIADWKFHGGDETVGPREAGNLLRGLGVEQHIQDQVVDIVATISFKGSGVETPMKTLEGACVQDADRLDAIGAIGIARCFAYGGHAGRVLYAPQDSITFHQTADEYKSAKSASLNHFYEKLFLIKDRMNTPSGREIAEQRHAFMEEYVTQFLAEWNMQCMPISDLDTKAKMRQ